MGKRQQQSLECVAGVVADLLPGASTEFPRRYLDSDIGPDAVDQAMQLLPGADRCISVFADQRMSVVRFRRLEPLPEDDLRRRYVATNQREEWTFDGSYWTPRPGPTE